MSLAHWSDALTYRRPLPGCPGSAPPCCHSRAVRSAPRHVSHPGSVHALRSRRAEVCPCADVSGAKHVKGPQLREAQKMVARSTLCVVRVAAPVWGLASVVASLACAQAIRVGPNVMV